MNSTLFLLSFYVFAVVGVLGFINPDDYAEGDKCTTHDHKRGTCRLLTQCPLALRSIRAHGSHNLVRCSFSGYTEIVCCPDDARVAPLTIGNTEDDYWGSSNRDTNSERPWRTTKKNRDKVVTTSTTERIRTPPPERPVTYPSQPFWETTTTSRSTSSNLSDRTAMGLRNVGSRAQRACDEFSNEIAPSVTLNILGGTAAEQGEFPHMAAVGYNVDGELKFECGGSLISNQFVLTAAHCVVRIDQILPFKVRLGEINLTGTSNGLETADFEIEESIPHPEYRRSAHYHDVALLRLRNTVSYSLFVHPACLYTKLDNPRGLIVTGWGVTDVRRGTQSASLMKLQLSAVDLQQCNSSFAGRVGRRLNRGIIPSMMCAGSPTGDSCQGDSGGPLQIQLPSLPNIYVFSVVGVTSFGIGCGSSTPGVYTRVASYVDWIEGIVWPN